MTIPNGIACFVCDNAECRGIHIRISDGDEKYMEVVVTNEDIDNLMNMLTTMRDFLRDSLTKGLNS